MGDHRGPTAPSEGQSVARQPKPLRCLSRRARPSKTSRWGRQHRRRPGRGAARPLSNSSFLQSARSNVDFTNGRRTTESKNRLVTGGKLHVSS